MGVNNLPLILAVSTLRREPNRTALAQLLPITRHAHAQNAAQRGIVLIAGRGIIHLAARCIVRIVSSSLTGWITLATARNLCHRRRPAHTTQARLNPIEVSRVTNRIDYSQILSFLVDS